MPEETPYSYRVSAKPKLPPEPVPSWWGELGSLERFSLLTTLILMLLAFAVGGYVGNFCGGTVSAINIVLIGFASYKSMR